ncbi:hypothetical protein [Pseudorhodoplanes sinuspersici]|nr:hypothetical protein [Pseudorhodoplanes sinuspersici]RKE74363.1 hypothetical protein DFP91_2269 [Pseudorhodoplanes sinuspersici]
MVNLKGRCAIAVVVMGAALVTAAPAMFFAAGDAVAQTGSPASSPAASSSGYTAQGNISPTADQVQSFVQSLENFVGQSLAGPAPAVGAKVPEGVKTQPMPPAAAAAVPEVKDHHVAKMDDQTILIVDPATGQIVGMISASDGSATTGAGTPSTPAPGSNGSK